ncbi:MAG: gluconokinase, partial [Blastochloris sp.]|nr:gluconokinase [Blastochloris sp.]
MKIIIGLDVGTTGCKAVAVNQTLRILAVTAAGYPLHSPSADRAEQDIAQVWRGCTQALRSLTRKLIGRPIAGLCLSGAMHSLMMVDQDHKPRDRAWTWADARCAGSVPILQNNPEAQKLYHRTGCPLQAMYHPARLHWLKHHDQAHFRSKPIYVGIKDALLHKLTGRWVTDWAIASATGLLNLQTHQWDEKALHQSGIISAQLPEPVSPFTVVGALLNGVARQTGLPAGLPVIAGGSDGLLANIGAGGVRGGEMVATVGTTGALRRITTSPLLDKKARTWCYVMDENRYLAGGAINNGGLTLQWIHDHFYKDQGGFDALFKEAKSIKPGCDGLMLLP